MTPDQILALLLLLADLRLQLAQQQARINELERVANTPTESQ